MTTTLVFNFLTETMLTAAKLAAPILLSALAVGVVISLFQAVTQIQDMTMTFIPKVIVIGLVIAFLGHWMLGQFTAYVHYAFADIPRLLGRG